MTEKFEKNDVTMISTEEAAEQVVRLAKRMALMYHHIGEVLTEELGKDKAKALLQESIWRYGYECGQEVREKVSELGLPLTAENYTKVPDLPDYGWKKGFVHEEGKKFRSATYCPFAEVWKKKGSQELGRIYCVVDEAKYAGYNDLLCVHLKNVLDDDDCCVFSVSEQSKD